MRVTTIVAFLVVASAGPAFSVPLAPVYQRDLIATTPAGDDSGAFSLKGLLGIGKDIVKAVFGGGGDGNSTRRDFLDNLMTREPTHDEGGAFLFRPLSKVPVSKPISPFVLDGHPSPNTRELMEFVARSVDDTDSEALNIFGIFKKGLGLAKTIFGGGSGGNATTREFIDIWARDGGLELQEREFVELMGRALDENESGAFNFLKAGLSAVKGLAHLFGGGSDDDNQQQQQQQQQRDFMEIIARADADDQSGALKLTKFGPGVVKAISNLLGGESSGNSQQQQRDFIEMFARTDPDDASGALNFLKFGLSAIKGIAHLFGGGSSDNSQQQQQSREYLNELFVRMLVDDFEM